VLKDTIQGGISAAVQPKWAELDETNTCREATEIKPDPRMQCVGQHQEIPKGEAAVTLLRGLRKRRMFRNLAAGRRQKTEGIGRRTQEYGPPCISGMAREKCRQKNSDPGKV
jgi:hypothetical protein